MQQEIGYKGYTTQPSDRACQDGDMALSLGMVNEDGGLRAVFPPEECYEYPLPNGVKVLYRHRTSEYRHVIVQYTGAGSSHIIAWFDEDNPTYVGTEPNLYISLTRISPQPMGMTDAIGVESIGNTLVVLMEDGMHYYLYQPANSDYKHLGTHLPELELSFGLRASGSTYNIGTLVSLENPTVAENYPWSESDILPSSAGTVKTLPSGGIDNCNTLLKKRISDTAFAKINEYLAKAYEDGKFVLPFLVRYAYRLYDGNSLVMHSSPVLMITNTNGLLVSKYEHHLTSDDRVRDIVVEVEGIKNDLDYECKSNLSILSLWSDIIDSVDIFVSAPIYTFKTSGEINSISWPTDYGYNVARPGIVQVNGKYTKLDAKMYDFGYYIWYPCLFDIPRRSDDDIIASVRDTSNFYLLRSIPISELSNERTLIVPPDGFLKNIVTYEAMTDDYETHDTLIPRFPYIYNQRLNIANLTKRLAIPQQSASYQSWTDDAYEYDTTEHGWVNYGTKEYKIWVYTKANGRDVIVSGEASELGANAPFLYFYYPDPNAYKIVVRKETPLTLGDTVYYELPLKRHDFLNGAVFFEGFEDALTNDHLAATQADPTVSTTAERTVQIKNKIYTSEVGNPFYFPVEGIVTVGLGEIVGMSAATNALSEGQFGQFPLYAFTTDGVYALEVDAGNGLFGQVHPIPRDVCINPDSITQTDDSVLFASKRGIMVLSGRQSACISDEIFAERPFDVTRLPGMEQLHGMVDGGQDACVPTGALLEFVAGCRMVYDYVHQHVVVYNPTKVTTGGVTKPKYTYAYVWSLKSKMWGMMRTDIAYGINSYPEALAVNDSNKIVSFSSSDAVTVKGLAVTRPLTLGARDVLKSVHTLIQRGMFRKGTVKTVLWGSRDLQNWVLVGSSVTEELRHMRGSGYKWFRIGVLAELKEEETVEGATVEIEARQTNVLR